MRTETAGVTLDQRWIMD